jgi:tripartite-type tricarboxylate transporter receptor subunit TctC
MNYSTKRRALLQATATIAAMGSTALRAQEAKGPLRIIVAFPAGGVADVSVRFMSEYWTAFTKQNVIVENRPGGAYQIAMQALLNAPPDGQTWIHLSNGLSAAQATFQRYDMLKQLTMLGTMGTTPGAMFVNANAPFQTASDLLDWIKANPNKFNYGAILGSIEHMWTATLLKNYGLTGTVVGFKGGPDACTALAQGEIQLAVSALPLIVPFKGKIRPVAVLVDRRNPLVPDVTTAVEQKINAPLMNLYGAFAVHASTPKALIDPIYNNLAEVMKTPALIGKLAAQGMFAGASPGESTYKAIAEEIRWMTPVATELNLKAG